MKHTILCGHTGSSNRGCEAIIKSTIDLLADNDTTADIATYDMAEDIRAGLGQSGSLITYRAYAKKDLLPRLYNVVARKGFGDEYPGERFRQRDVFAAVKKAGSAVTVGGDTYCYGRNARVPSYSLNTFTKKNGLKSFLWSCSVNAEKIDREMAQELKRYTMIFPREQLTYQNLLDAGIPEERLFRMSDSAFVLRTEAIDLPEDFSNVFAYNPSFTLCNCENGERIAQNRIALLKYILKETDMKIALIPHVFKENYGDLVTCLELEKELDAPDRVTVLTGNYSCGQLKRAISNCRMLFAERTHASIAGYSQCVPTFVVGYSVKSLGIAADLFGTAENRVIPRELLTQTTTLLSHARRFLDEEAQIRTRLMEVVPAYTQRARDGAAKMCQMIGEAER